MTRYFVRPRADWYPMSQDEPLLEGRTVFEASPIDTGILDHDGNRIWKAAIDPIGFVALKERP